MHFTWSAGKDVSSADSIPIMRCLAALWEVKRYVFFFLYSKGTNNFVNVLIKTSNSTHDLTSSSLISRVVIPRSSAHLIQVINSGKGRDIWKTTRAAALEEWHKVESSKDTSKVRCVQEN